MVTSMEKLINHLKTQGFIFQGSEIYGGLANSWDYGPLGAELKQKVKDLWWNYFIRKNHYNLGLDSSIIMNTEVWKNSGHLGNFNDPLIDCKKCKSRFRADKIIEEKFPDFNSGKLTNAQLEDFINKNKIICPKCGSLDYTSIRNFELMFKTNQGVIQDDSSAVYLRPETAQGIFINFKNVQRSLRKKLPFGIGQIGKSFRNEITPGNFIFRTREFEQMELEFFFDPDDKFDWFNYWIEEVENFLTKVLGFKSESYSKRVHEKEELAHYSKATTDFEYNFIFGRGELWGVAHRGDFDLKSHSEGSKHDLTYLDPLTNKKITPNVIEPSVGLERLILAILTESYCEEDIENGTRTVLKLPKKIAPFQLCVLPLQKQQNDQAFNLYTELLKDFDVIYDETGNIGKRYRRQDAIGTPLCVTIDFETENDNCVTIRERDSMNQKRVNLSDLKENLKKEFF
ncbi:glycyl-tRNA synthetase [Spiroplasma sabaudiense Ar-1343]|uniref:Glycine--tRNA ligase n=1 Tax=Spiroplasma sabaudiense Ar-1343 TaxID=1276257 RepID=W6A9D8_9MOLU|nr:glycine--tRNA ligase [Spiroplasma sabaudiense]AHI53733.1 glycyl-tRNA synthetase [Spiroplasma sabaudiense Ar-1343]